MFWTVFWFIAKTVAVMGISYAIAYATRSKGSGGGGAGEVTVPTCESGRPLPIIFGTPPRLRNPNVLWWGDLYVYDKERHDVDVAYFYYVGMHCGYCRSGIDGVKQIWWGDKVAWPTAEDETDLAADGTAQAEITSADALYLYGTYKGGEMGLRGTFDLEYGAATQTRNSYLEGELGSDLPAFRGLVALVTDERVLMGCSPYLKTLGVLVKANQKLTDGSAQWYLAKAAIATLEINPVHMLRQILTDTDWGEAIDTSRIGSSFETVADTLYTEGLGLSYAYYPEPDNLQDFVDDILEHINGVLYEDHANGTIEIAIVRDDYDADTLAQYDESDFTIVDFVQPVWGEIPGRVVLYWSDRYHPESTPDPAVYDDIANQTKQGKIEEVELRRPMICSASIANAVVAREGRSLCTPAATVTLRAKRTMAHLHPADVIKISYDDPDLAITSMILRVVEIHYGKLGDDYVTLDCVEDVFATGQTIYGDPPDTQWTTPTTTEPDSLSASASWEVSSPSASVSSSPSSSTSASASSSPSASVSASASEGTPSASVSGSPSSSVSGSASSSPSQSHSSSPSASPSSSPSSSAS